MKTYGRRISATKTYKLSEPNLDKMSRGKAPIGVDGKSVNLHHNKGIKNDFYDYREITRKDHYKNFKKIHLYLFGG